MEKPCKSLCRWRYFVVVENVSFFRFKKFCCFFVLSFDVISVFFSF